MNLRLAVLLVAVVAIGVLGYIYLKHDAQSPLPLQVAVAQAQPILSDPVSETPPTEPDSMAGAVTGQEVASWTADVSSGDAAKRAAALTGLARAPVEQALPVLRRALLNGEPVVDRKLALQSLRDLALEHGDANGAIRNAIREAIYHGDDQTVTGDAQEAIDVIEESLLK